jgi:uncharacterized glyoxalase superfamily protein PhnB
VVSRSGNNEDIGESRQGWQTADLVDVTKNSIGAVGCSINSSSLRRSQAGQLLRLPHAKDDDMQKITPFLWFNDQAEEAMHYYISIFKRSKVVRIARYGDTGPGPKGSVMTASFELEDQQFTALNGGPRFKFTEAISFVVDCADQAEVDELWDRPMLQMSKIDIARLKAAHEG